MEKVQVMNVSPAACLGRVSGASAQSHGGSHFPHSDQMGEFVRPKDRKGSKTSTNTPLNANILNNNIEVNGLLNGGVNNSSDNDNNNSDKNNIRKKSFDGKNCEQGSLGYVSERVRALSVSNRPKTSSSHRFGPPDLRASYNDRLRSGPNSLQPPVRGGGRSGQDVGSGFVYMRGTGGLYRSNSSLELDHDTEEPPPSSPLRREYGSHGSINVASAPPETLYSILRELKPAEQLESASASADNVALGGESEATSPKVRSKFQKLWDKDKPSIFKKLRSSKSAEGKTESKSDVNSESSVPTVVTKSSKASESNGDADSRGEDSLTSVPLRRSAFAHYDCRSLAAQFNSVHMRSLLSERANMTTGASAAAMAGVAPTGPQHDSTEDLRPDDNDPGDGRSNQLIKSCPFFRNEVGGEGERQVSLSRDWGSRPGNPLQLSALHRPVTASTLGLLEPSTGHSHWRTTLCPYVRSPLTIEAVDQGASYYRNYFCGQEHQNWLGVDDALGPVAVSVRREKVEDASDSAHSLPTYQYRIIVRTSELFSCQGSVLEESLGRPASEKGRGPGVREVLEYVCPQLSVGCLRLSQSTSQTEEALLRLDDLGVHNKFKVGVLYCRAGQTTEEEMYNNEHAGPALSEFLEMLGQRVRLKDFDKYRGGLDRKTDSTGLYSVYTHYRDAEIMFHVSTLLPFTPNNRKQLLRKRHIGNDIVTIIFQEPGAPPFSPRHIRSHFQHVFIVVQVINPCSENTQYRVTVSRFRDVPMFGPMITEGATFPKSRAFTDFLLAKAINGEIAALSSEKFAAMATRTRHEYLKDLAMNHTTSTTLDTSSKFSLMGFSRGTKKDKRGIKFIPESSVRGALSWPLSVHDAALQQNVDCTVGISVDSLVVVEEMSAAVIFAAPCKSVIGWTNRQQQGLRVFYHQGECLLLSVRAGTTETDAEEIMGEIVARLAAVTQGAETQELVLRRNPAGLLGFNVQQDGVITEVEPYGLAAQAGLRQGARLVEICTVTLATLSQEQMVDLLKTSMTVTVTVVPPHPDGAARRGCNVPTCGFLLGGAEGDYENLNTPEELHNVHSRKHLKSRHGHGSSSNSNRYERSVSPPARSSNSSGYGTGGSSRSLSLEQRNAPDYHESSRPTVSESHTDRPQYPPANTTGDYERPSEYDRTVDYTGTLSSTSSGHSSDRWTEALDDQPGLESPPPPLPARSSQSAKRRGEFFQSSFHSRGVNGNPPSSHVGYVPPVPHPAYTSSCPPHPTYSPSGPNSLTPTPLTTSSPSPTSHSHTSIGGMYVPTYQWSHHKTDHDLDAMADNANYAVPPPHPRPLHSNKEDVTTHAPGLGDYDNAPAKIPSNYESRPSVDYGSAVIVTTATTATTCTSTTQASEYVPWRTERITGSNNRASVPPCQGSRLPGQEENPSSSERLHPTRSEDELSGSSGSPHSRRRAKGGNTTPSSTSSRNQSPRTVSTDARLRHAATPRKSGQRNSANLGSSNLQEELYRLINPDYISDSESLASRESSERPRAYSVNVGIPSGLGSVSQGNRSNNSSLDRASVKSGGCSSSGDRATSTPMMVTNSNKSSSSMAHNQGSTVTSVSGGSHRSFPLPPHAQLQQEITPLPSSHHGLGQRSAEGSHNGGSHSEAAEVVVLTARPATVISNSSATSSPSTTSEQRPDQRSSAAAAGVANVDSGMASGRESKTQQWEGGGQSAKVWAEETNDTSELNRGLDVDQEWMTLVNTATQAIQKSGDLIAAPPRVLPQASVQSWSHAAATRSGEEGEGVAKLDSGGLQDRVAQLERRLAEEQQRSEQLEDEVSHLRTENRKLQEDSRAAAHQLHQFTEWFFNTIDKT